MGETIPITEQVKPEPEKIKKRRGKEVRREINLNNAIIKVDINAEFNIESKLKGIDSLVEIVDTNPYSPDYPKTMIQHINIYKNNSSKEKEKSFPYHVKRIQITE